MEKRIIAIILTTVLAVSLLSGCGCNNTKKEKQVKEIYDFTEKDISHDKKTDINYINNVVILFLDKNVNEAEKNAIVKKISGEIVGEQKAVHQIQVRVSARNLEQLKKLCSEAEKIKGVKVATYDSVNKVGTDKTVDDYVYEPNDPWGDNDNWKTNDLSGRNWWIKKIHAPQMWKTVRNKNNFTRTTKFQKVKVGIVDDGFDTNHEDLDLTVLNPDMADIQKHGTHVAGIIGATKDNEEGITGVAPNAELLCYDCKSADEEYMSDSQIMIGLISCVERGAKIVNFSLGMSGNLSSDSRSYKQQVIDKQGEMASLYMAVLLEEGHDFVVVQAAGNGAKNHVGVDAINNGCFCSITSENCHQTNKIKYKDIINRVFVVANAEKPNENGTSYLRASSNGGSHVDVAAPGTGIYSTVNGNSYDELSGTSMAAPVVAGVLAAKWGCDSRLKGNELKECLNHLPFKAYDNKVSSYTTGNFPLIDAWTVIDETLGIDNSLILRQKKEVTFKKYTNARFGYSFSYPGNFKVDHYSDNGDGVGMKSGNDELSMYGSYDTLGDNTGEKIKKRMKSYGYKMSNMVVGKNAFYFEESKGEKRTLHYVAASKKYNVNAGFTITCTKSKLSYYREIGNEMIRSLTFNKSSLNQEREDGNDTHGLYQSFLKTNKFERYAYIDIDQDGQDELIAGSQPMICGIFGIKDGAVITLTGTNDINEAPLYLGEWLMDDAVLYSSKEQRLLTYTMGTSGVYYSYKKEKNKMTFKITGGKYGKYTINDKKVSSKKLAKYLDGLKVIKIKEVK